MSITRYWYRSDLLFAFTMMLGLLLAACTAAQAPATQAGEEASAPAQELVIGAPTDTYRTDERANVGSYPINTNIYDTLVRVTPDYQVEPLLATEWEFIEPNTWRFKLRDGVTFHDGQPLNAEAVKAMADFVVGGGSNSAGLDENSLAIVDDMTVDITPSSVNRRLVQQLTHPRYSIIAPGSDPATSPVGTGPFKFVEYVQDERIVVERNDEYWGDPAGLERMTFRFIPDNNTRVLSLKSGEVDFIYDVPREVAEDVATTEGLKIVTSPVGAYEAFYINAHGEAPNDIGTDPLVREAIALAIDKEVIVRDVWRNNAEVNSTMIPVRILGESASLIAARDIDLDNANALLDEAGWTDSDGDGIREKDGRPLQLVMVVGFPTPEIHRPMPEIVQAQLREIGIEVKIDVTPDTATYEDRLAAGTGDLWVELGNQNDANPCFLPALLFRTDAPAANYARLFAPGEEFDEYIDACASAVETNDVQKNVALAMKAIVEDANIVVPVAGVFRIHGMKENVQGFDAHPSSTNQLWSSVRIGE